MEWMNPHIYFYIDVEDADGKSTTWAIEGGAPNTLYRAGWRKDSPQGRGVVTVTGFLARDGSNQANMRDGGAGRWPQSVQRGSGIPERTDLGSSAPPTSAWSIARPHGRSTSVAERRDLRLARSADNRIGRRARRRNRRTSAVSG